MPFLPGKNRFVEVAFWILGLVYLAFLDPAKQHFSLCPFHYLNLWCPGCGLGRSISYIFHGEIGLSFHTHWFGVPALLIISHRIFSLIKSASTHKSYRYEHQLPA